MIAENEIGDARGDLGAETRSVEYPIMPDAEREVMCFALARDVDAKRMRGLRLADAGNVVLLAFHREQSHVADRARVDRLGAMRHLAPLQRVAHAKPIDGAHIR